MTEPFAFAQPITVARSRPRVSADPASGSFVSGSLLTLAVVSSLTTATLVVVVALAGTFDAFKFLG